MKLTRWVEQRIVLPSDSETDRSRKLIGASLMGVTFILTVVNAIRLGTSDLTEIGLIQLMLAGVILVCLFVVLIIPRAYALVAFVVLVSTLFANLPGHLITGGYTSGLWILVWIILAPVLAPLFLGRESVIAVSLAFALTVVLAAVFESQARSQMPDLEPEFVTTTASFNIMFTGLVAVVTGLYLFNQIERYRQRSESLLLNILPGAIAARLKNSKQVIADEYDDVTVLFADIVDFTTMSSGVAPAEVVGKLNEVFSVFDRLALRHGLEKIKTIGDAYMVTGGLPEPREDHCQAVAAFAIDMLEAVSQHMSWTGEPMQLRIGINRGPVVAGVIGEQKFSYDLWGDAVNVASRMESNGLSNQIQVTEAVREKLDGQYQFREQDPIFIKGKGMMTTYILET
jgi:class 3 adenylate cyclase